MGRTSPSILAAVLVFLSGVCLAVHLYLSHSTQRFFDDVPFITESGKSEQKGLANLLIGLFGAVRNPLAHAPKTIWPMSEQDALDILTLASLIHRKLDSITKLAAVSP